MSGEKTKNMPQFAIIIDICRQTEHANFLHPNFQVEKLNFKPRFQG